jgi:hypothetical protein
MSDIYNKFHHDCPCDEPVTVSKKERCGNNNNDIQALQCGVYYSSGTAANLKCSTV